MKVQLKSFLSLVVAVSLLAACGKKEENQGAPTGTSSSPVGNPIPGISTAGDLQLEDASPGTAITSQQTFVAALERMGKGFNGMGDLVVQSEIQIDYIINNAFQTGVQFQRGQITDRKGALLNPYFRVSANYQPQNAFLLNFYATQSESNRQYIFKDTVRVLGLALKSTDSVALFEQQGAQGQDILKVTNYHTKNPTVQRFRIGQPMYSSQSQIRLIVTRQTLTGNFVNTIVR